MDAPDGSYEYWLGATETKYSASGVERSVKPADTIRRAEAVLDIIGVTKVADVTDLDRVGIPNFMTVRPHEVGRRHLLLQRQGNDARRCACRRADGGDRAACRRAV